MSASDDIDSTAISLGACSLQLFKPLDLIIESNTSEGEVASCDKLEEAMIKTTEEEMDVQ
jgi:hypothetical protein